MNIISPELQTVKNNLMETHTISNYQKVQKKKAFVLTAHTEHSIVHIRGAFYLSNRVSSIQMKNRKEIFETNYMCQHIAECFVIDYIL